MSPWLSLIHILYGAVDLFVVGQYADSAAVSAVAVGSHVMQTVTCLVTGLATGGTVLIGHRVGARDEEGTANAIGTLTVLFLIIAGILTPVMLLSSGPWITLMQTPAPAVHYAWQYLFACSWGMPFIIGYNVVSAIYRGLGDSRTPVYFLSLIHIFTENIKLNREIGRPNLASRVFGKSMEILDFEAMAKDAEAALRKVGMDIDAYLSLIHI